MMQPKLNISDRTEWNILVPDVTTANLKKKTTTTQNLSMYNIYIKTLSDGMYGRIRCREVSQ